MNGKGFIWISYLEGANWDWNLNTAIYGKLKPKTNQGVWHVNSYLKPMQICLEFQNIINHESFIYIGCL